MPGVTSRLATLTAVAAGGLALAAALECSGQPFPLEPAEVEVSTCTTCLNLHRPHLALLDDGVHWVVWSGSAPGEPSGIQARRFRADGIPLESFQFQVNSSTTTNHDEPAIAAIQGGGVIVAWENSVAPPQLRNIEARRFGAGGAPLDPVEFQVNAYTSESQLRPEVAAGPAGDFIVVWDSNGSFGSDDSGTSIQARRFGAGGAPLDPVEFQVNTFEYGFQFDPVVAVAPRGDFVVAWYSQFSPGSDPWGAVMFRRFSADGNPLDPVELQANTYTTGNQGAASVAVAPDGSFVVVWVSDGSIGSDQDLTSIQGRRYAPNGSPFDAAEFQVNNFTGAYQSYPSLAVNAEGDFVVAWDSFESGGGDDSDTSTQVRRFRSDGTAIDAEEFQVNTYTTSWQGAPTVAALPDGDFVVTWLSDGSFVGGHGSIQRRRFGRPTIPVTTTSGGTGGPGCTLRDAITAANTGQAVGECPAGNEGAVVELPAESSIALTEADNGANALPLIERPVTIRGRGARVERDPGLACPVGPEFRLFEVADGGVLTLEDVAVSNGCLSSGSGAGVFSGGGSLVLREASIEGNEAGAAGGGVALVDGNLLSFDSSVRGNLAGGDGGGIAVAGAPGWVLVDRTTLSENVATSGGGLSIAGTAPAVIRNSTFSGNVAASSGGGLELADPAASAVLDFSTVTGNSAPTGAGASVAAGGLFLHGSLLGENLLGADCVAGAGNVAASGLNLDTDGSCAALAGGFVTTVASLGLAPLADQGGLARTHLPLAGSPALDSAPACSGRSGAAISLDGRGYPRPTDDDGDATPECELGAVERGPVFLDGFQSGDAARWSLTGTTP